MRQPKKTKWRKQQKRLRHLRGKESRGCELNAGDYGLRVVEAGQITARQLEAGRVAISRTAKRVGKLWIRVFPDKPISRKPAETRMGKGKGSVEYWVANVRPGRIVYELTGVAKDLAVTSLKRAAAKLPLKCEVVIRSENLL
ncbi:MAG: 50S ribosomal protein L16 [Bdellovibrionales bacterium]|nr:50S ribosomal protein L16 [Bdellovibrionales bacterium]